MELAIGVIQAIAAIVAAAAAVAMWRATIHLVEVTRGLIYVQIAPKISFDHPYSQPFRTPKESTFVLENVGRIDLDDVELVIGSHFQTEDGSEVSETLKPFKARTLKPGKKISVPMWQFAKQAIEKQSNISDSLKYDRELRTAPVVVKIRFKHGISGVEENLTKNYRVEFSELGELCIASVADVSSKISK